jgi:hypothetical protein
MNGIIILVKRILDYSGLQNTDFLNFKYVNSA